MQQKETTNPVVLTDVFDVPPVGRIIAIDPGTKRCGVAVCDELRVTTRPLPFVDRTSWKKLLSNIAQIVSEYDAKALVIGLPLESDGTESVMSVEARSMARKFALSLSIPVFLQDERVTSYEAKARLWQRGTDLKTTRGLVDSEAATIILSDFLDQLGDSRMPRSPAATELQERE
ncbi:MAG: Holliday junction resolvase RuvX [Pyrinomonadaceae bacterium]